MSSLPLLVLMMTVAQPKDADPKDSSLLHFDFREGKGRQVTNRSGHDMTGSPHCRKVSPHASIADETKGAVLQSRLTKRLSCRPPAEADSQPAT